jgi:hypothetical protein
LVDRINKPQILTEKYRFYDILEALVGYNALPAEERNKARKWPWSAEFAIAVAQAKPGDDILGGKLAPSEFDFQHHTAADLPEDPLFRGKSYADVIRMRNQGELDHERALSRAALLDFQQQRH